MKFEREEMLPPTIDRMILTRLNHAFFRKSATEDSRVAFNVHPLTEAAIDWALEELLSGLQVPRPPRSELHHVTSPSSCAEAGLRNDELDPFFTHDVAIANCQSTNTIVEQHPLYLPPPPVAREHEVDLDVVVLPPPIEYRDDYSETKDEGGTPVEQEQTSRESSLSNSPPQLMIATAPSSPFPSPVRPGSNPSDSRNPGPAEHQHLLRRLSDNPIARKQKKVDLDTVLSQLGICPTSHQSQVSSWSRRFSKILEDSRNLKRRSESDSEVFRGSAFSSGSIEDNICHDKRKRLRSCEDDVRSSDVSAANGENSKTLSLAEFLASGANGAPNVIVDVFPSTAAATSTSSSQCAIIPSSGVSQPELSDQPMNPNVNRPQNRTNGSSPVFHIHASSPCIKRPRDIDTIEYSIPPKLHLVSPNLEYTLEVLRQSSPNPSSQLRDGAETTSTLEEKKFFCRQCTKYFSSALGINYHVAKHHQGEHRCHICDATFSSFQTLEGHQLEHEDLFCSKCGKLCRGSSSLNDHLRIHEFDFKCSICDIVFDTHLEFVSHHRTHLGDKYFGCETCKKSFLSSKEVEVHHGLHLDRGDFACSVCSRKLGSSEQLDSHMKIHDAHYSRCDSCLYSASSKTDLEAHIKASHGQWTCPHCGISFESSESLEMHSKTHPEECEFKCNKCNHLFSSPVALASHLQRDSCSSSDSKQFQCKKCDKEFSKEENLQLHYKLHLGQKDYICLTCHKSYFTKSGLQTHQKHFHMPNDGEGFKCNFCEHTALTRYDLSVHEEEHGARFVGRCEKCDITFRTQSELKRHYISKHSGRPFSCSYCSHKSKTKEKLERHLAVHLSNEIHQCQHCGKKFSFKNSLVKHLRKQRCNVLKIQSKS